MIKYKDLPLVSLSTMNEVHFEEINILNTLLEQLDNKAGFEKLSQSFDKLLEHMQEHFSGEEKLMKETQYPSLHMHKADHDKVLNGTRYAQMQWRNKKDEDALKEYFEGEIVPWLDQHIKAMDTPMADYVSQMTKLSDK